MNKLLILALAGFVYWFCFVRVGTVELGPGVHAPYPPVQQSSQAAPFNFKNHRVTPLAEFALTAKVLSRKDYQHGRDAELIPLDLALGWGRMSDESVLQHIEVSQSNRWYYWRTEQFPIPRREIETHSANMHIVPADTAIESTLQQIRTGDIVSLRGQLVKLASDDGWQIKSSLSRKDTGAGACEVIFVQSATIETL